MPVRSTMADLIARVRRLIGDLPGASQQFDDQAIQDALDERRLRVHGEPLRPAPVLASGQYLEYAAAWGTWESDVRLQAMSGTVLAPAVSDLIAGRWVFAAAAPPPVLLTGSTYDCYGVAADLLEQWAALAKLRVTASTGTKRVQLSDQLPALLRLADSYRTKARPMTAQQVRADLADDVASGRDDSGVTQLLGDALRTQRY
jgi:hypothetical protein